MTTSAQDIVDRSMRLFGATEGGAVPTSAERADGLIALNAMISSWQLDKLMVYAFVDTAFTMVVGTSSYTVGPAGNFALTPRPPKIEGVYVHAANIDYGVDLVDNPRWNAIPDKTTSSDISHLANYEATLTTGTLKVWPVPSAANSLHIVTWTSISELAALATSLTLSPGVERALSYNLSVEFAPEFNKEAPDSVKRIAGESLALMKKANKRPMLMYSDLAPLLRRRSDIYSGGPA